MVERILRRLGRRFIFVVGKGGVGKTTTAGALALACADRGTPTHLISTDPAHSLGDLFGVDLSDGVPRPSPCGASLVLEELDAPAFARERVDRGRLPVLELFDRGTYLDLEDLEPFLDLTLPGVDEVAAILRLAELAQSSAPRVVVDTAPTGHALRLLDAGSVVESWTRAFDAMGEKAAAVMESLTRRRVRFAGQDFVEDLARDVRRFQEDVLGDGAAVVVERSGSVVEAETRRLLGALGERGLSVACRVRTLSATEAPGTLPEGVEGVPFHDGLEGCEGLRRWGRGGENRPTLDLPPGDPAGEAFVRALHRPLLLFVGKGGVGKSTCATATALALARDRPVTLLSTDPAGSLEDVLGGPPPEEGGDLRVHQVEARARFDEVRDRYRDDVEEAFERLGLHGAAALDRKVVASLLDLAPPGLDEVFALLALLEDVGDGRTVVMDTAPTGHLVRLLATPALGLAWTRQLMRFLLKYRATLGLDAFAERLLDFAKRLKDLNLKLRDPEWCSAVVVTLPGPLVAAETARLREALQEAGIEVAAVIHNRAARVPPPGPREPDVPRLAAPEMDDPPVGPRALRAFLSSWSMLP